MGDREVLVSQTNLRSKFGDQRLVIFGDSIPSLIVLLRKLDVLM